MIDIGESEVVNCFRCRRKIIAQHLDLGTYQCRYGEGCHARRQEMPKVIDIFHKHMREIGMSNKADSAAIIAGSRSRSVQWNINEMLVKAIDNYIEENANQDTRARVINAALVKYFGGPDGVMKLVNGEEQ